MGFDPCNHALKIQDSNSYNANSFGSVKVHSLTLFAFLGTCDVTPMSFSWPTTLQPLASVMNPGLRLQQIIPLRFRSQ